MYHDKSNAWKIQPNKQKNDLNKQQTQAIKLQQQWDCENYVKMKNKHKELCEI